MALTPRLYRRERDGVVVWTDPQLEGLGAFVGFSERVGGVSQGRFCSLNLAGHVGDDVGCVNENRTRLLRAAGLAAYSDSLTMAEQIHGSRVATIDAELAGSGAQAGQGRPPIPGADAIVTTTPGVPLMLCYADCVPVCLVAPGCAVGVVHAGWRGALVSLPGRSARELALATRCEVREIVAYIGPHIGSCHYEISADLLSQFCNTFGTFARAESGGLDLDAVVTASLVDAGVAPCSIARLGVCTAETTDRFFSYRAEDGRTGRHSALACVLPSGRSS